MIPEKWVLYSAALLRLSIPISGSKNPTDSGKEYPAALLRLGFFTVSNSSPIISLGAVGRLDLFKKCFKEMAIPLAVYEEILRKKESPEAISLQKAIAEKWVTIERTDLLSTLQTDMLGSGEKEAISLAAKHKAILIIDDDIAKTYAQIMGVESHGTLYVLIIAVRKHFLNKREAIDLLNHMMKAGFYISTEVYGMFLQEI